MNDHETYETLAAVYAVGALDGDDLARFEAHLAEGCDRCETIVRESREALVRMALAATPSVPPADVRAALQARIDAAIRRPSALAARRGWLRWAAATAAVVALAVMLASGVVASRYEVQLGQIARDTARERERLQSAEAALRTQVAALELLRDPETRVIELRSPSSNAIARVIWNDKAGGHLLVANLAPAPEGKAYEVWALGGAAPRPAGLFQVGADGRAAQKVDAGSEPAKGFAVTLEPAQGVPAPTGPIVLASK
jgi:anti-sigma-K factor RskA